eukprot:Nk52_evm7s2340 gene=Nk52_evmTU7s2340
MQNYFDKNNAAKREKEERVDDHILGKYDLIQLLGKGAYGVVWKALDKRSGEIVALKKIFDAFQNATDAQRTFREIMFLQEFNNHDNIIKLLNVLKANNDSDIYLVFEYMDTDLHNVIRARILQGIHQKWIMYQILLCIRYMHSGKVIHRDLKPSNVLLDENCQVKVADFGLARSLASCNKRVQNGNGPVLTDYIATRWYRAPEILLGSTRYTKGIDLWSIGCILAEMLGGRPLFPGTSSLNQVDRIFEVVGRPSEHDLQAIQSPFAKSMLDRIPFRKKRGLEEMFPSATREALDLLKKLLVINPDKRITTDEALKHPFLSKFYNAADMIDEVSYDVSIPLDDNVQLSLADYRQKLYDDIVKKKKALKKRRLERAWEREVQARKKKQAQKDKLREMETPQSEQTKSKKEIINSSDLCVVGKQSSRRNAPIQLDDSKKKSSFPQQPQQISVQSRSIDPPSRSSSVQSYVSAPFATQFNNGENSTPRVSKPLLGRFQRGYGYPSGQGSASSSCPYATDG